MRFFHIWTSKVRTRQFFTLLTWKRASRQNGVHFFDIWTSKSGPTLVCFVHFDLEMCFAPQRPALFWHLNFQTCSEAEVLCTFWLWMVLRAPTACTFSTSQKVLRSWGVFLFLTWKCVSRHKKMHVREEVGKSRFTLFSQWFVAPEGQPSNLAKAAGAEPSGQMRDEKSHAILIIFFSSLIFSLGFSSVTLPTSAFPSVHIVGSLALWLLNFLREGFFLGLCKGIYPKVRYYMVQYLHFRMLGHSDWEYANGQHPMIQPKSPPGGFRSGCTVSPRVSKKRKHSFGGWVVTVSGIHLWWFNRHLIWFLLLLIFKGFQGNWMVSIVTGSPIHG